MITKREIPLKSDKEVQAIIRSFKNVFKTKDINELTKGAYNFIYLCPGFIAHYNHNGFKGAYEDTAILALEILENQRINQWENFHPGQEYYEYNMQKKEIYNAICRLIPDYN